MSIAIINKIRDNRSLNLTTSQRLVLVMLASRGKSIFPSLTTLQNDTALSRRGLIYVLNQLTEKELITKNTKSSKYKTNEYTINLPKIFDTTGVISSALSAPPASALSAPNHKIRKESLKSPKLKSNAQSEIVVRRAQCDVYVSKQKPSQAYRLYSNKFEIEEEQSLISEYFSC